MLCFCYVLDFQYDMNDRATCVTTPLDNMLNPNAARVSKGHFSEDDNAEVAPPPAPASSPKSSPSRNTSTDSPTVSSMKGTRKSIASQNGSFSSVSNNKDSSSARSSRVSFAANPEEEQRMVSVCFDIEDKDSISLLNGNKKKGCPCVIC